MIQQYFMCHYIINKKLNKPNKDNYQKIDMNDFPIITENSVIKNLKECFENYQMKKSIDNCSKCH